MLVIRLENGNRSWNVGQTAPQLSVPEIIGIKHVTADDSELNFIAAHFPSVPIPSHKTSVSWWGDEARFIVANL